MIDWVIPDNKSLSDWYKKNNLLQDQWGHPIDNANFKIASFICKQIYAFIHYRR